MNLAPTPAPAASQRLQALDALRGVAILMVMFDHLFAIAGERMAGGPFAPTAWVREWISGPLGIIQDFGWLGVCLFFLISGFVITRAGEHESMRVFVVRRFFRIFPPLAAAILIVALLDLVAGTHRPWTDYLLGMTLAGYFTVPQVVVLGVAWTLVIEVIFYAMTALLSPLLKTRRPELAVLAGTALSLLSLHQARLHGDSFFLFAASMAYVPLLLIGSTLYLRQARGTGLPTVALLLAANLAVFLMGLRSIHTSFLPIHNSYLLGLVYALGIFAWSLGRQPPRALTWVGDISYSLYLLHGTIGFALVQQALAVGLGAAAPFAAGAICLAVSYAFYRTVERPAMNLGKKLTSSAPDPRKPALIAP